MRPIRTANAKRLRPAALLLALFAGAAGAAASSPPPKAWSADPEEQFLLDVNVRQLRLGEGVRAYNTPEGTCVVLGDFLTTLDVPMRIDLGAKRASGWAFSEKNQISIDYAAMTASYGGKSEHVDAGVIRETPEGWCVQASALSRWFGIGVKPMTAGSALILQSDTKLPVELAIERQRRATALAKKARLDIGALPQVRIPYRMWRAPALDFVVSAGVTYRASDGVRVDRQSSVYAAGEIARLSYDAQMSTTRKGLPNMLRFRAFRSDPDSGLLGPLKATHIGVGDVQGFDSRLTGTAASGRGAVITNRPLAVRAAFDRTRFEGDLPVGWEAELYRNDELLGFDKGRVGQRYVFDNVPLMYGENRVRVVLYGPQGQVRTREEMVYVGQDNVPPGKTYYWAGLNQPGRDILTLARPPDENEAPRAQATASLEHGVDERTSVGALARLMLLGDDKVTFVEATVRRSIGSALVEVGAARESTGGQAARAQLVGKFGSVNVSAETLIAKDFHLQGRKAESSKEARLALDAPIRIGQTVLPAHAEARYSERGDGARQLEAAARLSANFKGFNLATDVRYRRQLLTGGSDPPPDVTVGLIGTGRIGDVRVRGLTSFDLAPSARMRTAELSAYWSASDQVDWEGALAYDAPSKRARARVTHIRRMDRFAAAITGEAATDGSVALGLNLSFSLDPRRGFGLTRQPLAQAGVVAATVYRDLNDNGVRDPSEPFEKGALVTTGTNQTTKTTDARGRVLIGGLTPYTPLTVGLDLSSLSDPTLAPKQALQVVVPRPGIPADVAIGLVGGGDIEGTLIKSGGLGFEGIELELVDHEGKVAASVQTDFDGFFLIERVPYGRYVLRVAAASADAAHLAATLAAAVEVRADQPVVRLGSIVALPRPTLAAANQN